MPTRVESSSWELHSRGRVQEDLLAVCAYQGVLLRIEGQVSGNGKGGDQLRRGDKGMGGRVGVIASGKVTVVGGDDGVGLSCRMIYQNSLRASQLTFQLLFGGSHHNPCPLHTVKGS